MASFAGGSAYAMAKQITEGYTTLSAVSVKRFSLQDLKTLRFELERIVTAIRADVVPEGELDRIKLRNRKLSRLSHAMMLLQGQMQRRR